MQHSFRAIRSPDSPPVLFVKANIMTPSAFSISETINDRAVARKKIDVRGVVQGVGFRPFVFRLATKLELSGFVRNTSEGAVIEVEGTHAALGRFIAEIVAGQPPLAQIEHLVVTELVPWGQTGFDIQQSLDEIGKFALVSPDVGNCEDCYREITDPNNRRFHYPFTNCTNCGPRNSIVYDIPYDRHATTMAGFKMCATCQAEYDEPTNRRFHAQPNACPACGPGLALVKSGAPTAIDRLVFHSRDQCRNDLLAVRRKLREGAIVAIKGIGGFNLVCDAENDTAVRRLRERKRRSDKPFAVMAPDIITIGDFCTLAEADTKSLTDPRRPIVILTRRTRTTISEAVAPNNNTVGVMLPHTPLHHLLFRDTADSTPFFKALVMTSGNLSEEPIVSRNEDAIRFRRVADWYLLHNRDISTRVDDSVVRTFEGKERALRRARGYAPSPIALDRDVSEILACGAELKNTFCLTKGHYAFLSQHIGDLSNYETVVFFQETLERMKKLFRVAPRVVAHDLHPLYLSTKIALELPHIEKIGVQHHHAHIASCMAENRLREKVIGIAFDGTGYGTDGQIWGGEFMVVDFAGFERYAHFRYIHLAGGDTAVRQPWRAALGWLQESFGRDIPFDLSQWTEIPLSEINLVRAMIARDLNTVQTSSCGRLFDAVASILGLRHSVTFEGQAAIELEMCAREGIEDVYPFEIQAGHPLQVDFRPTIEAIVREVHQGGLAPVISSKFHNSVAAAIVEIASRIRSLEGLSCICLSGGTFQNMYLLKRAVAGLRGCDFTVYLHSKVPPNDGGISLGQAVIANEIIRRGH